MGQAFSWSQTYKVEKLIQLLDDPFFCCHVMISSTILHWPCCQVIWLKSLHTQAVVLEVEVLSFARLPSREPSVSLHGHKTVLFYIGKQKLCIFPVCINSLCVVTNSVVLTLIRKWLRFNPHFHRQWLWGVAAAVLSSPKLHFYLVLVAFHVKTCKKGIVALLV